MSTNCTVGTEVRYEGRVGFAYRDRALHKGASTGSAGESRMLYGGPEGHLRPPYAAWRPAAQCLDFPGGIGIGRHAAYGGYANQSSIRRQTWKTMATYFGWLVQPVAICFFLILHLRLESVESAGKSLLLTAPQLW